MNLPHRQFNIGITLLVCVLLCMSAIFVAACAGTPAGGSQGTSASGSADSVGAVDDGSVCEFRMDIPESEDSAVGVFLYDWVLQLKEASAGRIYITIYPNSQLGETSETIDNLKRGVSDIAWGTAAMFPDRFPVTEGTNLPMLNVPDRIVGTDLLNDLYTDTNLMQEEYEGIKPLAIYMVAPHDTAAFLLMNPDAYATLPDDLKEIFDELSKKDVLAYGLGEASEEASGSVGEAAPAFSDADRAAWFKKMKTIGYDGQTVLDAYTGILDDLIN
jgi:TRAP-type C4-dicarboxylate transport system substrate-binding protein